MTRRGLLTAIAVVTATSFSLAMIPMRTNGLTALGIWAGAVALSILIAKAIDAAVDRREQKALYSEVLREARRAMTGGPALQLVVGRCDRCGTALRDDDGESWPYCPRCP